MTNKKAAFQMSLGFIVAVVFAVVLLTLAIVWIQGLMGDIGSLTTDLTSQAQIKIGDTFAQSSTTFAIWPTSYNIEPGHTVKLSAGIKNNAPDSQRHDFVIGIVPAGASYGVCPEGDVEICGSPDPNFSSLDDFMKSWATVERSVSSVETQTTAYKSITVQAPTNAMQGSYIFNVVACYDRTDAGSIVQPNSFNCRGDSDNIWGNTQSLTIQVES